MSKAKQLLTYSALLATILLIFTLLQRPAEDVSSSTSTNDGNIRLMAIVDDINKLQAREIVGVMVDLKEVSVNLWISSEPGPELFGYLQKFDVRGKGQPFVRLHRAPYTLDKLNQAKQKVTELVQDSKIEGGVVLSGVSIRQDGEGISLTVDVSSATPDSKWIASLEKNIGVPVFVDPNKTDIDLL